MCSACIRGEGPPAMRFIKERLHIVRNRRRVAANPFMYAHFLRKTTSGWRDLYMIVYIRLLGKF